MIPGYDAVATTSFNHSIPDLQFALDATFPGFDQALIPMAAEMAEPPIKRPRIMPTDRGIERWNMLPTV